MTDYSPQTSSSTSSETWIGTLAIDLAGQDDLLLMDLADEDAAKLHGDGHRWPPFRAARKSLFLVAILVRPTEPG